MYKTMRQKLIYASLGFAALALVACGSADDRAKAYYESGNQYLEQKDYTKAAIEFRNALKLKEDFADAWFGMSKIEEQSQNWPRVVGNLNKVLEINPKHEQALENLAKFMLLAGDFPTALKHANAVAALKPNDPTIIALRAAVLLKMKDREGGVAEARKALQLEPHNPDATILLAADLLEAKQVEPARAMADEAIKAHPKSLGLLLLRIRVAEVSGDIADQELAIRNLVAAFPERREFKDSLAGFLVRQGRTDEAEKEMRASITGPDDVEGNRRLITFLHTARSEAAARAELTTLANSAKDPFPYMLEMAEIDYGSGKGNEAIDTLRQMAKQLGINEHGIQARISLAQKLLETKQFDELEKVIGEVIANDARNVSALKLRGAMQMAKGNLDPALNDLREALNFDQSDATIRLLLANVYERKTSYELAEKELLDAFRDARNNPDVGIAYAGFLLRRGAFERAEEVLTDTYAAAPQNRQVLGLLADLRMRRNDWKGAEELARLAKEQSGDAEFSDRILGSALFSQGKYEDAIAHFVNVTRASPNDIKPMFNLVRAYIATGKTAEAEAFAKSVLAASPESPNAHIVNGAVLLALKKVPEAQKSYEMAVEKAPNQTEPYLALAEFHQTQGDFDSAIRILTDAATKASRPNEINMALAALLERTGRHPEAIKVYEKLVEAQPDSVVAVNNLVSLLTDSSDDPVVLQRAAQMAAILRDSPIPHFRETLGWALIRQGDVKGGLQILEKSIDQLQNVPAAQFHLGMAYSLDGSKALAAKHLKLALELEKNVAARERIIRALEILGPEGQTP